MKIPNSLKRKYREMIQCTLDECSVPCTLYFEDLEERCRECEVFQPQTPYSEECSYCNGTKKRKVTKTECLNLSVVFKSDRLREFSRVQEHAGLIAELMIPKDLLLKVSSCEYISLDKCNLCISPNKFCVASKPIPCGLFGKDFFSIVLEER